MSESLLSEPIYSIPPDLVRYDDIVFANSSETWHLPREPWRKIRQRVTGKGVLCAILDTGIVDHPALPKPTEARSFISGEGVTDRNGHGTHCAGTALGRDENIGVSPGAELLVGKVLSDRGSGSSTGIAAGVRWAMREGADVISMSLGGGAAHQPTIEAIKEAMDAGVWVVIASGNAGYNGRTNTVGWPARSGQGICTGATQQNGRIAGFSSGGEQLIWACPGQQILSTSTRGGFVMMSGTSTACPFGAGLACLIIELERREGHPRMKGRDAIHSFIAKVCKDYGAPGRDPSFGHGVPVAEDIVSFLSADDLKWL